MRWLLMVLFSILGICVVFFYFRQTKTNRAKNSAPKIVVSPKVSRQKKVYKKEVIGFLPYWQIGKYQPNSEELTQVIYSGFPLQKDGSILPNGNQQDVGWNGFISPFFVNVKNDLQKRGVKVLISITSFDRATLESVLSNPKSTATFLQQIQKLVKTYQLDGINIDFEYPTPENDSLAKNVSSLVQKIRQTFQSQNPSLVLAFDIHATAILDKNAYQLSKIGEASDEVIIMTYDYHLPTSLRAGPVAPLYGEINEHSVNESISTAMQYIPSEKLIMGIPFYGYEWQTANENFKSTAISGSGALASYTRVKELLQNNPTLSVNWDDFSKSSWIVTKQNGLVKQIYFEDARSLSQKLNYLTIKDLGGIAIWALGYEGNHNELWDVIRNSVGFSAKQSKETAGQQ